MQAVTTIGLDIAKSVFQIHGVDAAGNVIVRRQLKRRYVLPFFQKLPPCLIGVEACASSHHWSRELRALGHTVRLMPAAYVKPYVKRQKNDAADAEAICEAVTRANMRFVATKTLEQQSCLMLHRTRHLFIRQQTAVINAIRAHLAAASSHRSDAMALNNCSMWSPTQVTNGYPTSHVRALPLLAPSFGCSRPGYWSSIA
jgi:transposase